MMRYQSFVWQNSAYRSGRVSKQPATKAKQAGLEISRDCSEILLLLGISANLKLDYNITERAEIKMDVMDEVDFYQKFEGLF